MKIKYFDEIISELKKEELKTPPKDILGEDFEKLVLDYRLHDNKYERKKENFYAL